MKVRKILRKLLMAAMLVFLSTLGTLLCRQFSIGPQRPSPAFRTFGPANARIRIYEFTDFACPACRTANAHMKDLLRVYKDSVRLNFKHYPLSTVHPWSFDAAASADCAGRQGKFTEYADLLFENQQNWAFAKEQPKEFLEYAKKLKLDLSAFEKCADEETTLRQIKLDIAEGDIKGVNSTPTFFVNGKRAVGAGQLLDLAKRFDNLLKELKN
ncbi:MAG: thioredoxin domain-containing protein [Elusimicrobia bacterium]|nr:thioredoxin domain-containing protein [Elusimicrobiota bacterium]